MSSFMKKLASALSTLIIIVGIIAIIGYAKLNLIFSHILKEKFKTKVSIEEISLSPMELIEVNDFKVFNPPKYKQHAALHIRKIKIAAPYVNFAHEVSQINKIVISDLTFTVDFLDSVTNWEILMNNLDSFDSTTNSYMIIDELTFLNLKIRIQTKDGTYKEKTLAKVTLKDVKTKEGELTQRLIQAIIRELIFNIRNLIDIPLKMTKELLNKPIDSSLDGLKSLNPFK
ncbi:MAG: hypothetical protein FJZ59_06045 [Chlamydiae bacterium]|jgi:hypothetical protein|nr:hypothetical protein [Chlamydiota bacterium]